MACASHEKVVNHLFEKYREETVDMGLAANGSVVQVLASEDGATWSIIMTHPNGKTCMIATGEMWEHLKLVKGEAS